MLTAPLIRNQLARLIRWRRDIEFCYAIARLSIAPDAEVEMHNLRAKGWRVDKAIERLRAKCREYNALPNNPL